MTPLEQWPFREAWAIDFEFEVGAGERPVPVCLCARELRSGRELRVWRNEFGTLPPYSIDADSLFVGYYASAELGCHLALGWPMPARILDLFIEFRNATNGINLATGAGRGLINALAHMAWILLARSRRRKYKQQSVTARGATATRPARF